MVLVLITFSLDVRGSPHAIDNAYQIIYLYGDIIAA